MSEEPKRPDNVPAEAQWDGSSKEWGLGKSKDGKHVGEWKWWLAPNGHLVCQSHFDNNGNLLEFKRFHPNGEVSREGTMTKTGKWKKDVYFKSSESTSENFAYGSSDEKVWKAVKRIGEIPVSFDYFDRDGKHLNPELEPAELESKADVIEEEAIIEQIRNVGAKSFSSGDLDESFFTTAMSFSPSPDSADVIEAMIDERGGDVMFVEKDLHVSHLDIGEQLSVLVVDGNLTVDGCLATYDDPLSLVIVTGNLTAGSIVVSGGIFVTGDVTVSGSVLGDYNHGYCEIAGALTAKFFYPEEYFFSVGGEISFDIAFGNTWRLNENNETDEFDWNKKTVREFFELLHPDVTSQIDVSNETYLDDSPNDGTIWEYVDRHSLLDYVRAGNRLFKK